MNFFSGLLAIVVRRHVFKLYCKYFDASYYTQNNQNIVLENLSPARHFLEQGWQQSLDPCAWFCTADYLKRYPDVAAKGINPFLHFLEHGFKEGRVTRGVPPKLRSARVVQIRNYIRKKKQQRQSFTYLDWVNTIEPKLWSANNSSLPKLLYSPKISICMATYNTKPRFLEEALDSVLSQSYDNWELCIADDCSTNKTVRKILAAYSLRDNRVKVTYRNTNGHIATAMNTAIQMAQGEYVAFLDHDDLLVPQALFEIAVALNNKREIDFLYSDEDIIDEGGKRIAPHFKSGWNPELLKCHNYITHLSVIRRELLNTLGNMRAAYNGAQDYDLMLRIERTVPETRICHIPLVLYHWRAHSDSTAAGAANKNYATTAGQAALEQWVLDSGLSATVEDSGRANFYRVNYHLSSEPRVAIIIPSRDMLELLQPCVESLLTKTAYQNYHIYIVDNQSEELATKEWLESIAMHKHVSVLGYDKPFNYSKLHNQIIADINQQASPELICLLNNDTKVISPKWLTEMASVAMQEGNGCVGAKLLYPDNTVQHAGVILGLGGYAAHAHRGIAAQSAGYFNRACLRQNLSAVTAACMVVKNSIYQDLGGMDEAFEVAYNDVDFCLRVMAAGHKNVFTPHAQLIHYESKSRGQDSQSPEKVKRFNLEKERLLNKWQKIIEDDPYYNPNLTRSTEDFALRTSM